MDSTVDRLIGLCCLVVAAAVIYFLRRMPADTKLAQPRKIVGWIIAVALILYGLDCLIFG